MEFNMNTTGFLRKYLLVIVVLCSLFLPSSTAHDVNGCPFDSIYSFGDAVSSASNGLLMVDQLASAFHLPSPIIPYKEEDSKFRYGASFEAAGATAMPVTFLTKGAIPSHSFDAQFESFTKLLHSKICSTIHDHQKCVEKLQRALFFVDRIGMNDYKYAFLNGNSIEEVSRYVPLIVYVMKATINKLIKAGARNLLVSGILPMGCLPSYLTLFQSNDTIQYNTFKCHVGLNIFTRLHNDHLQEALMELRKEHPQVHIVYADYYDAFMHLLRSHSLLGFRTQSLMKACCGIGGPYNVSPTKMCGNEGVPVCSDPATYIHWDGFHLTQEAQRNILDALVSRRGFIYPEFKYEEIKNCIM